VTPARALSINTGWQGALVAALLQAVTMPIDLWLGRGIAAMPIWAPLASSACGFLLAGALLIRRRTPTAALNRAVFLINIGVILGALWMTSSAWATQIGRWNPFQANKLGALAAAMLAPDLTSGVASILGFVAMVAVKYLTLAPEIVSRFPTGEPWTIVIYGVFSLVLLVYRLHAQGLERQFVIMRSERAASERLARTFLTVRDFSNTPLQTIELASEVIRARDPDLAPVVDRIDRSVDRLFRLHHTFSAYESHLKWTPDDVSPDGEALMPEDDRTG
jgi:hypothetical protein